MQDKTQKHGYSYIVVCKGCGAKVSCEKNASVSNCVNCPEQTMQEIMCDYRNCTKKATTMMTDGKDGHPQFMCTKHAQVYVQHNLANPIELCNEGWWRERFLNTGKGYTTVYHRMV